VFGYGFTDTLRTCAGGRERRARRLCHRARRGRKREVSGSGHLHERWPDATLEERRRSCAHLARQNLGREKRVDIKVSGQRYKIPIKGVAGADRFGRVGGTTNSYTEVAEAVVGTKGTRAVAKMRLARIRSRGCSLPQRCCRKDGGSRRVTIGERIGNGPCWPGKSLPPWPGRCNKRWPPERRVAINLSCESKSLVLSVNGRSTPSLAWPAGKLTHSRSPAAPHSAGPQAGRDPPSINQCQPQPISNSSRSSNGFTPSAAALALAWALRVMMPRGSADVEVNSCGLSNRAPCFAYSAAASTVARPAQANSQGIATGAGRKSSRDCAGKRDQRSPLTSH